MFLNLHNIIERWLIPSHWCNQWQVGTAVECRTRDSDHNLGQVPCSKPSRCVSSLCPWARHFTLHCWYRPWIQWVTFEGRFVSRGTKLRVSGCLLPKELRCISSWRYTDCKGPMTREGTCPYLHSRLWAWMWTQNSDVTAVLQSQDCVTFTVVIDYMETDRYRATKYANT